MELTLIKNEFNKTAAGATNKDQLQSALQSANNKAESTLGGVE
jgi:hypothetical protein